MTRKPRPERPHPGHPLPAPTTPGASVHALGDAHDRLRARRRFLLNLAGGSLALLFAPLTAAARSAVPEPATAPPQADAHTWDILEATLEHLLPSETDSPGAREIHALDYFRFVITDPGQDETERDFLRQGTVWLDDLSREREGRAFPELDATARERLLRLVAASPAGENWLSTVLLYLLEALLCDPVYGGNHAGRGWDWLQHTPGFPRPPADKTYPELLKS